MLARHSVAPRRLLDVQSLALAAGAALPTFTYANYGRLGHDVARTLKSRRREWVWTRVLGVDSRNPATGLVQWELFPQVAAAVRTLGWRDDLVGPDPIAEAETAASGIHNVSSTVREALIEARLGQGAFRQSLISQWGTCAVTGCSVLEALRASHIRPWRDSSNQQRLDPDNGLLLLSTLDALFDAGLISFSDTGTILIAPSLRRSAWRLLGIKPSLRLRLVPSGSVPYLKWHRSSVFAGSV
jgi:hypothetical protein